MGKGEKNMAISKKYSKSLLFLILPAFCIFFSQGSAFSGDSRSYVSYQFLLELDGAFAGYLKSAEGGNASGEVISESVGPDYFNKKRLSGLKYEDITLNVGANMSRAFYQWIKETAERRFPRKNGAVIVTNIDHKEVSRIDFSAGLITEVTFPAADGNSKDPAYLQVKITPQAIRSSRSSGKAYPTQSMQKTQKNWLPSHYRFRIDGLDAATVGRTYKTSAPTLKVKFKTESIGEQRDSMKTPAVWEISNLTAWVAATHSEPLYQWFENFVLKGNNADNMEKTGTLEYFDPSGKEVLFKLTFDHMGIFRLTRDMSSVAGGGLLHDKAEMYIENIRFDYAASWQ
jgi:phage tail-like protein